MVFGVHSLYISGNNGLYDVSQPNASNSFGQQIQFCRSQQFLFVSDPEARPFPDSDVQGAIYVYEWSNTNHGSTQNFKHLTTISLRDTEFELSSEFGRSFAVESDCETLYVALNDGVFVFKQTAHDHYTMSPNPIQRKDPDFGVKVFYYKSPIIMTGSSVFQAASNNLIYTISEPQVTCAQGIGSILHRNTSLYVICKNSNKLDEYNSETFTHKHSYELPDNSLFAVSNDGNLVIATNSVDSVVYVKHTKRTGSLVLPEGTVRYLEISEKVLAVQTDSRVQFTEIDMETGETREEKEWIPCNNDIHKSQFLTNTHYIVTCENEKVIRGCEVVYSMSTPRVVLGSVLGGISVVTLIAESVYFIIELTGCKCKCKCKR